MLGKLFKRDKSLTKLLSEKNKSFLGHTKTNKDSFVISLKKSSDAFKSVLLDIFNFNVSVDLSLREKIEEALLKLDFGVFYASKLSDSISKKISISRFQDREKINEFIKSELLLEYSDSNPEINFFSGKTNVFLVVGSNGSGKTTSVAKLAWFYKKQEKKVLIVAADTFRAGAVEQLKVWSERLSVDIFIPEKDREDPSSVIYKALDKYYDSNSYDLIICDTSGRQHNNQNLLREINKVYKTIKKFDDALPQEVLLIVDSTIGQSSFFQAQSFLDSAYVTGIILTKMDNLIRGGIIFSIKEKFNVSVKWIGTGETLDDLSIFNLEEIVDSWLTTF